MSIKVKGFRSRMQTVMRRSSLTLIPTKKDKDTDTASIVAPSSPPAVDSANPLPDSPPTTSITPQPYVVEPSEADSSIPVVQNAISSEPEEMTDETQIPPQPETKIGPEVASPMTTSPTGEEYVLIHGNLQPVADSEAPSAQPDAVDALPEVARDEPEVAATGSESEPTPAPVPVSEAEEAVVEAAVPEPSEHVTEDNIIPSSTSEIAAPITSIEDSGKTLLESEQRNGSATEARGEEVSHIEPSREETFSDPWRGHTSPSSTPSPLEHIESSKNEILATQEARRDSGFEENLPSAISMPLGYAVEDVNNNKHVETAVANGLSVESVKSPVESITNNGIPLLTTFPMSSTKSVAFVTGCSEPESIGAALALALLAKGYRVFASARSIESMHTLGNAGCDLIAMDVTKHESIDAAVASVSAATGGRLNVLINNAGIGGRSPALDVDINAAKEVFETNVWGMLAVCQAFAPLLVSTANPDKTITGVDKHAVIVNIGSAAGTIAHPWNGIYSASKAAVHSITDALRLEMAGLNVKVTLIIAGGIKTAMSKGKKIHKIRRESGGKPSYYDHIFEGLATKLNQRQAESSANAVEPKSFASTVLATVLVPSTPGRLYAGSTAFNARWVVPYLPHSVTDAIAAKNTHVNMVTYQQPIKAT